MGDEAARAQLDLEGAGWEQPGPQGDSLGKQQLFRFLFEPTWMLALERPGDT